MHINASQHNDAHGVKPLQKVYILCPSICIKLWDMQTNLQRQKAAGCWFGEGSCEETFGVTDMFTILVVLMVLRSLPVEWCTSNMCRLLQANGTT